MNRAVDVLAGAVAAAPRASAGSPATTGLDDGGIDGSTPALRCCTDGAEQTRQIGAALATVVEDCDLLVLSGDLGAGKTALVQGLAAALGVRVPVTSPTFTLANRYEGRLVVHHLDVYRFETLEEVRDLALEELLESGLTVVEWGERIASTLVAEHLLVAIRFGDADDQRILDIVGHGDVWLRRAARLADALDTWRTPC